MKMIAFNKKIKETQMCEKSGTTQSGDASVRFAIWFRILPLLFVQRALVAPRYKSYGAPCLPPNCSGKIHRKKFHQKQKIISQFFSIYVILVRP